MNSRRSFFKQLLTGIGVFTILPPALTYERLWQAQRQIVLPPHIELITCQEFIDQLMKEVPRFDEMISKDIKPGDGWIGSLKTGKWEFR